jgi:transposase-like protein
MKIEEQIKELFKQLNQSEQKNLLEDLNSESKNEIKINNITIDKCPHCQSKEIIRYGKSKDVQRYKCSSCNKTFSPLTGTFMHHIKKKEKLSKYQEILKTEGIIAISKMAKKLGISIPTAFEWRHKLLLSIPKKKEKFEAETQMDDIWFLYSQKGRKGLKYSRKRGGSKRQGDNNFQVKLLTASDKKQVEMQVTKIGRITKNEIIQAVGKKFKSGLKLITDGHNSYKSFAKEMKLEHVSFIAKEHKAITGENVQYINNIAGRFKTFVNRILKGVSTKYLQLYANLFTYFEKNSKLDNTTFLSNKKIWDIYSNIEKMYESFILKKSVRTYRCPTKRNWKAQNWNSDVIDNYSYI